MSMKKNTERFIATRGYSAWYVIDTEQYDEYGNDPAQGHSLGRVLKSDCDSLEEAESIARRMNIIKNHFKLEENE